MPFIRSELGQSVGTITLDNPAKRNALCATLVGELVAALAGFELEKARAVVLRAAPGVTVWSSGTTSTSCPRALAIRWDGTTRCATSCGVSRPSRPR